MADEGDHERDIVRAPIRFAWRLLPDSFRRGRRSTVGSCGCATTAFWSGWTAVWSCSTARAAGAPPALRRGLDSQSVKTTEAGGPRGYDAGKESRAESATPSSTPTVVPWCWSLARPTCRTATAAGPCWLPRATPFPSSRRSSPTALRRSGLPAPRHRHRDSSQEPDQVASPSSPGAGSSSASSPGSAATAASPRTRGDPRIRPSLPLRRLHRAAHPTARAIRMISSEL